MKQFNDLAKKMSDYVSQPKAGKKLSVGQPEASDAPAQHSNASAIEEMHDSLASQICPDCHASVKAAMAKHGMGSGEPEDKEKATLPHVSIK